MVARRAVAVADQEPIHSKQLLRLLTHAKKPRPPVQRRVQKALRIPLGASPAMCNRTALVAMRELLTARATRLRAALAMVAISQWRWTRNKDLRLGSALRLT